MRMGAHTDYGILTVLLADDVAGLQVFRDGVWHDVSTPRGAFVCNLGDMLARWTNDRWISTLHRVVPPPAGVPVRCGGARWPASSTAHPTSWSRPSRRASTPGTPPATSR